MGFLSGLDTSVNIAFPALSAAFELDVSDIQWVVISFVLSYSILLLPIGRFADQIGHGRVVLAGIMIEIFALAACGMATVFWFFLLARIAQGVGIAFMLSSAPALVTLSVSEQKQPQALALFAMMIAMGVAAGAPIGGVLLQTWDWQSVYLYRVPYTGLLLLLSLCCALYRRPVIKKPEVLDIKGALALGSGLGLVLFVASRGFTWGWFALPTLSMACVGVGLLAAFVAVERKSENPLIDFNLFAIPDFVTANCLNALANAAMFTVWFLGPYFLITVRGHGTTAGGLILAVSPLATAFAAKYSARLVGKINLNLLSRWGLLIEGIGLVAMSRATALTPLPVVVIFLALVGAGLGLFQVPNMSFVMASIDRTKQGLAGGITQMTRTVGLVAGLAVWNTLYIILRDRKAADLGISELEDPRIFVPAYSAVLGLAGLLCLVGTLATRQKRDIIKNLPGVPSCK